MQELLARLKDEHGELLVLAQQLEGVLPSPSSKTVGKAAELLWLLERISALLIEQGKKEMDRLFPALFARLPEADHWQLRMMEIQDEAIAVEARHLIDWCAGTTPDDRFREHGLRLARWMCERVSIEEERLFPRL